MSIFANWQSGEFVVWEKKVKEERTTSKVQSFALIVEENLTSRNALLSSHWIFFRREFAVNAKFFLGFCFAFFLRIVWQIEVKQSKKYYFSEHLIVDEHSTLWGSVVRTVILIFLAIYNTNTYTLHRNITKTKQNETIKYSKEVFR